ncbi:hypothetical protein CK203_090994 [Vitis vinifera]|uniref:Uncharacterized protein n=1 Tax=Vitis vinifera TaxID=29760 RepID=A0A438CM31_VITVI|nr:hypothetical protein CK203_090994 [Vitis vinifera]
MPVCVGSKKRFGGRGGAGGTVVVLGLVFVGFLRNLVWATSKHDVYLMSNYSVMHWSSISSNLSELLNFSGHVAPSEKHPGSILEGFMQTQISTLAVKDNFLVAGGFQGELTCKVSYFGSLRMGS